ncbi:uncharacterized protein LOC101899401 isoform X2 [Musca domestica]|uniref:Uncharacterized protein LOC101899401 isoform X2 n=1 Tax=Musca domestica TaxID=7370 RepID=A0ABM3V441_MUSDO|nr:uncharacterized protein LOC101899401 isoform X2 [Musca domestica]
MGLTKHLYCLLWLFGLFCLINNSAAQSQSKRSSRITSSRTSFGTNVKSSSSSSSSSSSNSNGVNFDCPEEFGYYPHPTDCTQYYVCVFGGALLESCTGGLMYSHELQTCDWPRNVGCEVVDSGDRDVVISKQQQQQVQQQQQPQHLPSRIRFGSSFTSPQAQQQPQLQQQQQQQQQQVLKPTVPPQYHRQPPQVIQAQVQTIPPPPQLKVSPNPVITSRGQPKHLLEAQEEIAKLYADAHDSLPPVEEEESDRQQRVYRGQPSTVSQVQKDRDGILHQASINAIPSNDKYSSYNFGSQYRTYNMDLDLLANNGLEEEDSNKNDNNNDLYIVDAKDLDLNDHRRMKRDLDGQKLAETNEEQVVGEEEIKLKASPSTEETMQEISILVEELYGPDFKTTSPEDLMDLMKNKISKDMEETQKLLSTAEALGSPRKNENQVENPDNENGEIKRISLAQNPKIAEEEPEISSDLENKSQNAISKEAEAPESPALGKQQDSLPNSNENKDAAETKIAEIQPLITDMPPLNPENIPTEIVTRSPDEAMVDMEYVDTNDNAVAESNVRTIRQLRPYSPTQNIRPRVQWSSTGQGHNYRSIDSNPYQQSQQYQQYHQSSSQSVPYSFGAFNPYLSPPSTPAYAPLNSVNSNYKTQNYQTGTIKQKPKVVYTGYNLSLPPPPKDTGSDFRPMVGNYYSSTGSSSLASSTTGRPGQYVNQPDLLPYILQSLKELKEQRKKLQGVNFSYFHLDNQPLREGTTADPLQNYKTSPGKVTPNSHFSQISTVGGFYNNKHLSGSYPSKYPSSSYQEPEEQSYDLPSSTESNYFQYNLIANQKMKNFYSTLNPGSSPSPASVTSNINIVTPPKLGKFPGFEQFANGITYANSSTQPESYQSFLHALSSTTELPSRLRPTPGSGKPIKLQFDLPEFISNLQSQDMSHLNPAVVDMLEYVKEVHKERPISVTPPTLNINEVTHKPVTVGVPIVATTRRPTKGYESYLNSLKTTTKPRPPPPSAAEYYDEEYEEEEEDEEVLPPSQMPPYMPMTETMAPPRQEMMPPPLKPTENPNKNYHNYDTGFVQVTTTRRPFWVAHQQFQQFYQPQSGQDQQSQPPNQIPSFINFPSDYFQEIKQKLPARPQTSSSTSTTTSTTTTTTTTTTTARPMTSTTTTSIPKMRYTIRPNRNRGQNKWKTQNQNNNNTISNSNNNSNTPSGTKFMTIDLKDKPLIGLRKRPQQLASSSSGNGNNNLIMPMLDLNGPNRDIEYQQQQQQQQQQQHQQQQQYQQPIRQSTYRPLDVFTTPAPAPQSALRETYKPAKQQQQQQQQQPERPTYTNQQPLVYNSDYDEDLIAQIEQDNAYDQPTRPPPSRLNSNSNRNRGSLSSSNNYNQGDVGSSPVTSNRGTHPPRTRPTLKPSGTIVSKAQEFVDIYKNPPSRPEPLYPQPTPDKTAAKCRKDVCLLPDCYCGGRDIPGDLPVENVPQIVLITFDDSVNDLNKQLYIDLFEKGRVNPNGCPITATFYVSHEWTDYSQVQNLYADGHEMASHTVSHSFGEQFSQKKWTREVAGQREILAAYGGVKLSDVRGMRAPFLSVGGNKMFKMLYDSNFTYDSSMPVYENRPPSWPYTLDYKIFHDCMIPPCPTKSYPGVWQVPMVMWQDLNGGRCSMGDACSNPSDAEGVTKMIMKNFERHYTTNRAPFGLFYHAAWFTQPHHKEGFIKFLDTINAMNDVWIVTNWQALQWVRDPTPLSRINSFQPFQCDYSDRPKRCNNPKVCNLWHKSGVRYMKTCQPCPDIYPWTGKTGIRSSRIDNDIEDSTA